MKKFRFENTSKEAITEVLQRYEKVQFQKMIENAGYSMPKKLANFKLIKESTSHACSGFQTNLLCSLFLFMACVC